MKRFTSCLLLVLAVVAGPATAVQAAIATIDTFAGTQYIVSQNGIGTTTQSEPAGVGGVTLGNVDRQVSVQGKVAGSTMFAFTNLGNSVPHQFINLNAGSAAGVVTIDYKYTPVPGVQDFNPANIATAGIQLTKVLNSNPLLTAALIVTLFDNTGHIRSGGLAVPTLVTATDVFFPFATLFSGVDIHNIQEITVAIDTTNGPGNTIRLGQIDIAAAPSPGAIIATPEPASMALWSIVGLSGLGCRWYRRRRVAVNG